MGELVVRQRRGPVHDLSYRAAPHRLPEAQAHPDLLVALEPQSSPFPFYRPGNWPTTPSPAAVKQWSQLQLPIQIVPLPTYASWCNPIEKLWRKLRQQVTHMHPWADDLPRLRFQIDQFLGYFAEGSAALLDYVGLGRWIWPGVPD